MKNKQIFVCTSCGYKSPKWLGRCTSCGEWDSFKEEQGNSSKSNSISLDETKIYKLADIEPSDNIRIDSGIEELNRVLGGGIVPGSFILVGGDPGIGKSTLLLQMASGLNSSKTLYVTGEESLRQIKLRADRITGISNQLDVMAETDAEKINSAILQGGYEVVIVDSIQAVSFDRIESTPGSIIQVRECSSLFMQSAKSTGTTVFIIGHVTKDGVIAGPKLLEHMVDTVLQFEGERHYAYRILRALKNRFGSTNEIGIFEMSQDGMKEVRNPSELFLSQKINDEPGVSIASAIEGTRPLLLEVQALVSSSGYSMPQRTSTGYDNKRLQMILAVLEKRLGISLRQSDVFVNLAGGVYINDTSLDLGIAASIAGSAKDKIIKPGIVLIGEIGLTGEVRQVAYIDNRIAEAEKLGFELAVIPAANAEKLTKKYKIKIKPANKLALALLEIF